MELNVQDLLWLGMTIPIWVVYLMIRRIPEYTPDWLVAAYFYGKLSTKDKRSKVLQSYAIPKCWFKYFYMYAFVLFTIFTLFLINVTLHSSIRIPAPLVWTLDFFVPNRVESVSVTILLLVQLLTHLQVLRRVHECCNVSVYSKGGRIHWCHFIVGFLFYNGVQYSILSMGIVGGERHQSFNIAELLSPNVMFGTILFFYAFNIESDSTKRFARFRDSKEKRETYVQPHGGYFEYVSSPHYFAECLVYVALTIILGSGINLTWILCVAFTLVNQTCVASLAHLWYLDNFKDYPKDRKIIVPFLY